jgi:hypothetical protein
MRHAKNSGFVAVMVLVTCAVLVSTILFFTPTTEAEIAPQAVQNESTAHTVLETLEQTHSTYVLVFLDTMTLEMHDGTSTPVVVPIISKGKPGSYYETIGGVYEGDYKVPLHFSSIGHVYMPNSMHIFGNFFIHGIPYYPNGEKVSSNYSGGCIRLSDEDSKRVYDFVERGTPIIITKKALATSNGEVATQDMARLMSAIISLEFLNQDNPLIFNGKTTTRRALLKELLQGSDAVPAFFAQTMGTETFVDVMNKKALAIGLRDTVFISPTTSASSTNMDARILFNYITNYKSYLFATSTETQ